ncbi:hypothetical protein E5093_03630 [Acinetobacter indicus]|uniref:hypothetical protein n=2 Tax=Acinetobacter indicus TaxID=756892 RepID=UPI00159F5779|nr:hypothetical protein [Acinetobacter indicus]QLB58739.1 hypothetical protein E5093_03630 [Acinetobacter indicus]
MTNNNRLLMKIEKLRAKCNQNISFTVLYGQMCIQSFGESLQAKQDFFALIITVLNCFDLMDDPGTSSGKEKASQREAHWLDYQAIRMKSPWCLTLQLRQSYC